MNLTKRTFISYYTTHLGYLLMGGIFLLLSCRTEGNNNALKKENNITGHLWNFSCKLGILKNTGELIPYNQLHNNDYELLPQSSYTLKETINYKTSNIQVKGFLSIVRKEEPVIKKCLSPFAQTKILNESIKNKYYNNNETLSTD
ncbi:hypothetical protein [Bacteroides sp.]|uniref:hypothetical protein n=1 Tax=Bacteroides sp. TaxID=29523 RepID=UPI00260D07FC|nr:hypothetical protein [Bacteroides sp.]MDD3036258.1 hypothetical protein [Bacteroides sp.]